MPTPPNGARLPRFPLAVWLSTCCLLASIVAAEDRTWTSADGQFRVRASLIGRSGDTISLKRAEDGRVVRVPIARLSEADHRFLAAAANTVASAAIAAGSADPPGGPAATESVIGPESPLMADPVPAERLQYLGGPRIGMPGIGTIKSPVSGLRWTSPHTAPGTFVGTDPDAGVPQVRLTRLSRPLTPAQRDDLTSAIDAQLSLRFGGKVRSTPGGGDRWQIVSVVQSADGSLVHTLTTVLVRDQDTVLIQTVAATSPSAVEMMTSLLSDLGSSPALGVPVPPAVRAEIQAAIERWIGLLRAGDLQQFFDESASPTAIKLAARYPSTQEGQIERLRSRMDDVLGQLEALRSGTWWSEARYDETSGRVLFRLAGKDAQWVKTDGRWWLNPQ